MHFWVQIFATVFIVLQNNSHILAEDFLKRPRPSNVSRVEEPTGHCWRRETVTSTVILSYWELGLWELLKSELTYSVTSISKNIAGFHLKWRPLWFAEQKGVYRIRQEQCIPNHKLIICVLDLKEGLNKRKMEFVKRCKVGKLRDDVTAGIFEERVQTRAALVVKPVGVEDVWKNFKKCLIEEAVEETRGMRRHKESWWWNEEIAALVKEKQRLFKWLKGPKKCRKGCRYERTGRCKICRHRKEARSMDHLECSKDMESRNPMWSWNVFPSSDIWATHSVQEEVWRRQQEPEWDVLGLSSRSYLLSWQLGVHHTT